MSIKRKLTLTMMGISLTAELFTVAAITTYLIYDMRRSKAQELEVNATLTGDRNSAALMFLDNDRVYQNLEIFRMNPSVLAACIYDAKGTLFAGYQAGEPMFKATCPKAIGELKTVISGTLSKIQPIMHNGDVVGQIFMAADMREIDANVQKILQISAEAILLVFIMSMLITFYFQRSISGPLLELAATAQLITEKRDYTLAAKTNYADETGVLARVFNDMLSEVRKRDAELTTANETLEQKVNERTRELEIAKRKAEAASEAKSEFLRNMSHEFRTPLHAIINFSAYGKKEYEQSARDKLFQYFDIINKGSERLSRLVNEVLDLARLEHGERNLLLKPHDLVDIIGRSCDLMRSLLKEKGLYLHIESTPATLVVMCDQDKIGQVITNLLGNAIKFTPSGGTITVHAYYGDQDAAGQVVVEVIDEGVGIPETETSAIFESFHQSSRTKTGAGGTGLGLAICRGIITAHCGTIRAENNTNGKGARIIFTIPCKVEDAAGLITQQAKEASHENAA